MLGKKNFEVIFEKNPNLSLPSPTNPTSEIWCTINGTRRTYTVGILSENNIYLHSPAIGRVLDVILLPRLVLSIGSESETDGVCRAKMTGTIVSVAVSPGMAVVAGDILVVMESMKMESKITSPKNGIIEQVLVKPEQVVEGGQPLVVFKKEEK